MPLFLLQFVIAVLILFPSTFDHGIKDISKRREEKEKNLMDQKTQHLKAVEQNMF